MKKYEILGNNDTRSGFGDALAILGNENPNVVALCADLIGIAAGMTIGGKIPFTGTFANFSTARVYDQIR